MKKKKSQLSLESLYRGREEGSTLTAQGL